MSDRVDLERRYRRLLAFYPGAFRREHEEEMLAVLLAGSNERQRRPGLAASADLITTAIWMRVRSGWSRSAPTVTNAVRLISLCAAVALCTLIVGHLDAGGVRTSLMHLNPHTGVAYLYALMLGPIARIALPDDAAAARLRIPCFARQRASRFPQVSAVALRRVDHARTTGTAAFPAVVRLHCPR